MSDDPVRDLIDTARFYHAFHRWAWGWWCPGCRILERIDDE